MVDPRIRELWGDAEPKTIVALLRERARRTPDGRAYSFVVDGDKTTDWTYAELDRRARVIAARLATEKVAGRPVLLLYPPGLDYIAAFFGCLYAGAIAVPAYPPDPKRLSRTLPRLEAIVSDAGSTTAMTTTPILAMAEAFKGQAGALGKMTFLATDALPDSLEHEWREPVVHAETLAFLQYTSGSTSTPKGVMVSHGNLVHNLRASQIALEHDARSQMVSWLPAYHDMGLIGGILMPMYGGVTSHVMAPMTFLRRPLRWLETISRTRASTSVAPNFGYELCVRKISAAERDKLDLSHWRLALTGAEPVRAETLDAFVEHFAPAGFRREALYPCYGLAESTLMVTGTPPSALPKVRRFSADALGQRKVAPADAKDTRPATLVGCGLPIADTTVAIVDPVSRARCADEQIGEIWLASPSVARGYWRRREATNETFRARIEGDGPREYLRTGDLGFMKEEELFIAGRIKDVLIVRGRNYYPQDLELAAEKAHPAVRGGGGAAFSIEVGGREEIVLCAEVDTRGGRDLATVLGAIRGAISEQYDATPYAVVLLKAGSIPKTTSGKIQRHACKAELLGLELDVLAASVITGEEGVAASRPRVAARRDDVLAFVSASVAERAKEKTIDAGRSLGEIGLGYFALLEVIDATEKRFGVRAPVGDVLASPTIATIAGFVASEEPVEVVAAEPTKRSAVEIERWLVETIAARLALSPSAIDVERTFDAIGLDSAGAVAIAEALGAWLGRRVTPTLVWDSPTIAAAARALAQDATPKTSDVPQVQTTHPTHEEPIAVVGIGCRFPGARDAESFWRLLRDGRDAIGEVPPARWNVDELYAPHPAPPGKISSRWGAFLDRIDQFDAQFFGTSSREAARIDPQQRLLLEVAWEALEHAGISPDGLRGRDTGVFVGASSNDYATLQFADPTQIDAHACTGNAHSLAANRISYFFDFKGPSLAVDTACSASLVAVHLACESLRRGECSVALAGGVSLIVTPGLSVAFSQAQMLSPDGRCKTFDDRADGYVRGEGCGLVVLKRLSDALAAGDEVIAVVAATAMNHDGRSNGLTAPNGVAQETVIRTALARAGVAPSAIGYVEAHGTGTSLGDPIELEALARTVGAGRTQGRECLVGSLKTNIGHLEAAAGIAGLIKVALAVQHGEIPAHLHLKTPNKKMRWEGCGLSVPTKLQAWPASDVERIAGVSSFGFGGANAHVIVRRAPVRGAQPVADDRSHHAVCLSARTPAALVELARRHRVHFAAHPELSLGDVSHTTAVGRAHHAERAVIVAASHAELDESLRAIERGEMTPSIVRSRAARDRAPKVAFLFTGQGSQYVGMGKRLYDSLATFRETLDRCEAAVAPRLGRSLLAMMFGDDARLLEETRHAQPALFALEVALARVWMDCGITPAAVLGHSIGEYAAACVAGVLSIEDGARLVTERGRAMFEQPRGGGMLACVGDPSVVRERMRAAGGALSFAAFNAPENLVVAGEAGALEALARDLESRGLTVRPLRVSHAFHSAAMDGALATFEEAARAVTFAAPRIPLVSNVTGAPMREGEAPDATYFRRQLREPVQFEAGVRAIASLGCDVLVEIGPQATLLGLARATLGDEGREGLASLRQGHDDWRVLLHGIATLHAHGAKVDWSALDRGRSRRRVVLPTYPFERARHWFEAKRPPREVAEKNGSNDTMKGTNGWGTGLVAHAADVGGGADTSMIASVLARQTEAIERLSSALGGISRPPASAHSNGVHVNGNGTHTVAARARVPNRAATDVTKHVSAVSGFAVEQIALDARLGADLGLDSLMKIELDRRLARAFPELARVDRKMLPEDPTVADLMRLVAPHAPEPASKTNGAASHSPLPHVEEDAPQTARSNPPAALAAPAREQRFEDWPEYAALTARLEAVQASGANPYGRIHESKNAGSATMKGRKLLNFAAFNYLALSNHPRVCEEAKRAIDRYGTSASATPLLFGETPLHHELESEIASFLGTEAAIVFAGGHATNVATVGHLFGPEDLIVHDQWIHDSTVRGCILSGAKRRSFKHNDWRDLDRILTTMRPNYRRALVVLEGVYSQDGDIPNLPKFIEVKKRHDAMLMIDEAHSIGVLGATGRGVGEHFGVDRADVDLWMGTLSKALGSLGGYIAAREPLVRYLKFTTPLFIFSTGISPANAAAALEAIRVIRAEPERVRHVQRLAGEFLARAKARGLDTGVADQTTLVPIIVGEWDRALRLSNALLARGINAMPIGYPAVDRSACRLRFFLNYEHTEDDVQRAIDAVSEEITKLDGKAPSSSRAAKKSGSTRGAETRTCDAFVTGATGFIGRRLVEALVRRGDRVRALARSGSDASALASLGVEIVQGSLEDLDSIRAATKGARYVFNCAGLSSDWGAWDDFARANVTGVQNLLAAAEEAGSIDRLVHLSTSDVYGYPKRACDENAPVRDIGLPYNRSKVLGEKALWEFVGRSKLPVTVLRPVSVYGPRSRDFVGEFARALVAKEMLVVSGGRSIAGLVYVDDAIDAILAAAKSPATVGQAYNLRDGLDVTWRAYIDALAAGMKIPTARLDVPRPIAFGIASASEAFYGGFRVRSRPLLTRHAVNLLSCDQSFPIDKARRDFGFSPRVSLERGIEETVRWLDTPEGRAAVPR